MRHGEFRQDLKEIDFHPFWTVQEVSINPWISSSMDVDDEVTITDPGSRQWQGNIMLK